MRVTMTVNGDEVTAEIEPRLLLVHFIRENLLLTGTHWGCDTSNCGACVVWMDDEPVKSCTVLAAMASGRTVRTVEGMEVGGVVPGGAAETAGLLKGDRITAIDGKPVKNVQDYMKVMAGLKRGEETTVTVDRDGKELKLKAKPK